MTSQEITTAETAIRITQYEALQEQIAIAQQKAPTAVFQYRDPKGNKAARSYCYELRQLRSAVEKARKEAKAYALEYGRKVDGMAKELAGQVTALIEPHETEIKRIEDEEAERVRAHEETIARLRAYQTAEFAAAMDAEHALYDLDDIATEGLEEYREEGEKIKAKSRERMEQLHSKLAKEEEDEEEEGDANPIPEPRYPTDEEWARVKAAWQAKADREAEEEAKRKEAEAEAQLERERAEREREEAEAERQRKAEAEKAQREREAAEQARQAAEAEAERLRQAEAERKKREAEAEAEAERERAEAMARAKAATKERAEREEDMIELLADWLAGNDPEFAASAIVRDEVPNIRIRVEFAKGTK